MKIQIAQPIVEPDVTITMSAEEFVGLFAVVYCGASGNTPLRSQIEGDFQDARNRDPFIAKATRAFMEEKQGHVFARVAQALAKARGQA